VPEGTKQASAKQANSKAANSKARNAKSGNGRTTTANRRPSGRYTPPIPREMRRSPRWYPWVLLGLLIGGVAAIILNYIQLLPSSPSNIYTAVGLVAILIAAFAATRYR
jgi:hypothetical protein